MAPSPALLGAALASDGPCRQPSKRAGRGFGSGSRNDSNDDAMVHDRLPHGHCLGCGAAVAIAIAGLVQ